MRPLFSIIMASYNYARYLPEAIDSVLGQTEDSWELVVVDDRSSDDSWDVLQRYAHHPQIRVQRNDENIGGAATYNRAYALTSGEFIATLDSDDRYRPTFLAEHAAAFRAAPDLAVGTTHVVGIDAQGEVLAEDDRAAWFNQERDLNDPAVWLWANPVCHSAAVVRRDVHDSVGPFDPDFHQTPDWSFWIRCLVAGHRFGVIPRVLSESRSTGHGVTNTRPILLSIEYAQTTLDYWNPYFTETGRRDLAVQNTAGFFFRAEFAEGSPEDASTILEPLMRGDRRLLAEAIQYFAVLRADEVAGLRSAYEHQEAYIRRTVEDFEHELDGAAAARQQLELEIAAAATRLRRLDRIEATTAFRALQVLRRPRG